MVVIGDYAYLAVNYKKIEELYKVRIKDGSYEKIDISQGKYHPKSISIVDIKVIDDSNELLITYKGAITPKVDKTFNTVQFSENGDEIHKFSFDNSLTGANEDFVRSCRVTKSSDGEYYYSGSCYHSEKGSGIYIARNKGEKMIKINAYYFTDFENYFKHFSEKYKEKVEKKKEKRSLKGKNIVFILQCTHTE